MALVVFDASVLVAFLAREDAHHVAAVEVVRASLEPGTERCLCAVTLSEILVGPIRSGRPGVVEDFVERLSVEVRPVGAALALRGATVRARTGLALPDAYVVAVGLEARESGSGDVRVESFDQRLLRAYSDLATG